MNKRIIHKLCIICILVFGIILINKTLHDDTLIREYSGIRNVINADAAGYYVYLPAFFIYDFKADDFPDSISQNCGNGFQLENNKVISKYPLGVAMAYSPFFLGAHLVAKDKSGFSRDYHRAVRIAAVFYCVLGLLFSFLLFSGYVNSFIAFISLIPLYFGTNLIFYTLKSPCYSHTVSFCFIACFLYCIHSFKRNPSDWCKWLLPIMFGFIISIRLLNGMVVLLLPFWDYKSVKDSISFSKKILFDIKYMAYFLLMILAFLTPQFLYNQYLHGSIFSPMYPGEHFTNLSNPKWMLVLFGACNGLYIYTPLFIIFTLCTLFLIQQKLQNGYIILFYFIAITLIYASWSSPSLGCAFSHRGFLDYLTLFAFPFVITLNYFIQKKKWMLFLITGIFVYISCNITMGIYDFWWYCFYGKDDWDYFWLINDYFNFHHLKVD